VIGKLECLFPQQAIYIIWSSISQLVIKGIIEYLLKRAMAPTKVMAFGRRHVKVQIVEKAS